MADQEAKTGDTTQSTVKKEEQAKAYMHHDNIKKRSEIRKQKAKDRQIKAEEKKKMKIKRKAHHEDQRRKYLEDAKAKQDAFDEAHRDLHEHLEKRKTAADAELEKSREALKKKMMSDHPPSSHEKRKEMLNMLAKNISAKASAAEDRLLLKVDKLIDI